MINILNNNDLYEYDVSYENYKLKKRFINININMAILKDNTLSIKHLSTLNNLLISNCSLSINLLSKLN